MLIVSGCEFMSSRMQDRFSIVPPKTQIFQGDQATILTATQQAFKRLDFVMTRSSPARIDAVSRINSSVAFGDSRQLLAGLHLSEAGPGKTEVELSLTQQMQSQSVGGTSQQEMRELGFSVLYKVTLQHDMKDPASSASARNG